MNSSSASGLTTFQHIPDLVQAVEVQLPVTMSDVLVYRFEDTVATIRQQMPLHRINFFIVNYFKGPAGFQAVNQQHIDNPGWSAYLALIHPGQLMAYTRPVVWQGYGLFFTPDFGNIGYQQTNFLHDFPFFRSQAQFFLPLSPSDEQRIQPLYERLLAEYEDHLQPDASLVKAYINVLLVEIQRIYRAYIQPETLPSATTRLWEITNEFERLVEQHFLELRSTQAYAERLNVSPKYLSEVLLQTQGKPVTTLWQERLLDEAKARLRFSTATVAQIADQLRFEEPTYFSRWFRKQTGSTPLDYRRL